MQINFTSSEDLKETMMGSEKNDNIKEIFKSL